MVDVPGLNSVEIEDYSVLCCVSYLWRCHGDIRRLQLAVAFRSRFQGIYKTPRVNTVLVGDAFQSRE
jgi:hypothetical protein